MLKFSAHEYPYASQRQSVFARRGMVAASQPLAAEAGIEIMRKGGNAIDAAIATAAALTVVEPTGCGLGGDAFALVWSKGQLHGLNGNGHAPAALTIDAVKACGHEQMPLYGWTPVTVPGCPSAWAELSKRFGKLPFAELLQPAISLARDGFPLSPVVARQWQTALDEFSPHRDSVLDAWFDTFLIDGRAPKAGELFRNPAQARTLEELADSACESLYRGDLAQRLDAHSRATGGYLRASDLQDYRAQWVEPISVSYRGYDVWEIPPSGQGLVALMTLKILQGFDFDHRDSQQTWHRQLEAMKLAYSDGLHYITDPLHMRVAVADLLSDAYSSQRREQIVDQAQTPKPGTPTPVVRCIWPRRMRRAIWSPLSRATTTASVPVWCCLTAASPCRTAGRNSVSIPSTPTAWLRAKKPFTRSFPVSSVKATHRWDRSALWGYMQPQGHVQMVMNLVDFGLNPQAALDAPRWQWLGEMKVGIEQGASRDLAASLARRGHQIQVDCDLINYGRGQIIIRDPDTGVLCGGTEPRADSHIAVW